MTIITNSSEETKNFGQEFAESLQGGDIVLLYGNLGAGKTTFVKGLAAGLGISEEILSPTFSVMNIYAIPQNKKIAAQNLIHIDTYRLETAAELINIGILDYLGKPDTICIIEWPEKMMELLPSKQVKKITLEHNNEQRIIMYT